LHAAGRWAGGAQQQQQHRVNGTPARTCTLDVRVLQEGGQAVRGGGVGQKVVLKHALQLVQLPLVLQLPVRSTMRAGS